MEIISIGGIMLRVAALVVTLSVMNGFHSQITSKLLSLNPHIIIMNPFLGEELGARLDEILKDTGIRSSSRFIYGKGLIQRGTVSQGVVVKGVAPDATGVRLSQGNWQDFKNQDIVLGEELSDMLGLGIGDDVFLIIPRVEHITAPLIPRVEKFRVWGIFNSGIYEYDSGLVFTHIDKAKAVFPDATSSGVELYLTDAFDAEETAGNIKRKLKGPYTVQTWKQRNYNLFAALKLEKTMMFLVLVMIVIVATFNIVGSLIMVSVTRSKDCGIMRAVGATKRHIKYIFNFEGLFIGFFGSVFGRVYLISYLPVRISPADIGLIMATALIVSFLATLYPARRAGSMDVAQTLRYE
jgi:lipoprotein-releasing system permease protein